MSDHDEYGDSAKGLSDIQEDSLQSDQNDKLDISESGSLDQENSSLDSDEASKESEIRSEIITEQQKLAQNYTPVFGSQRQTPEYLTKYQKARVIGIRAVQISKSSPLYITFNTNDISSYDPLYIAQKELQQQKVPFIIRRFLPNSTYEDWALTQLKNLE